MEQPISVPEERKKRTGPSSSSSGGYLSAYVRSVANISAVVVYPSRLDNDGLERERDTDLEEKKEEKRTCTNNITVPSYHLWAYVYIPGLGVRSF